MLICILLILTFFLLGSNNTEDTTQEPVIDSTPAENVQTSADGASAATSTLSTEDKEYWETLNMVLNDENTAKPQYGRFGTYQLIKDDVLYFVFATNGGDGVVYIDDIDTKNLTIHGAYVSDNKKIWSISMPRESIKKLESIIEESATKFSFQGSLMFNNDIAFWRGDIIQDLTPGEIAYFLDGEIGYILDNDTSYSIRSDMFSNVLNKMKNVDTESFQFLGQTFAKDKNTVYIWGEDMINTQIAKYLDVTSFKVSGDKDTYVQDKNGLYYVSYPQLGGPGLLLIKMEGTKYEDLVFKNGDYCVLDTKSNILYSYGDIVSECK